SGDRILETYIRNLFDSPSFLIEPYLRDAGFLHMAHMGMGCKLDLTLVSVLLERWRLELGLPVDKPIVTGSVVATDWRDVFKQLLESVSNRIDGTRIDMNWLKRNFVRLDSESSERSRRTQLGVNCVGDIVSEDVSGGATIDGWMLLLQSWNHGSTYVELLEELQDIRLLLDQRLEAEHMKVPLVVYATVEMHKLDRVMRQLRFRQTILS
ncbi:hypothetical protein Gohar_022073, partial [Gossypium harknessii]|nr:hypothetical protein [Gossypium harknessii]